MPLHYNHLLKNTLNYLAARQTETGEFRSLESYPPEHPLGDKGWFYTDASPFIHANVLLTLLEIKHPIADSILKKGCQFIHQHQEWRGLWRFWKHGGTTHNVPIDLDDTALCSFLLSKNGYNINNKKYLYQNRDTDGYFLTWMLPTWKTLRYPSLYQFLKQDIHKIRPILASPMLATADQEPAVAANVLLYLGDNARTKRCSQAILEQLENPSEAPMQYYNDPLVIFYHVSRAFRHGSRQLLPATTLFQHYIANQKMPDTIFKQAMLASTYYNFELKDASFLSPLMEIIKNALDQPHWESHIYFVSKDRNFRAGSPELTAALCLEAFSKYQT